jgi:predicted nucleic acid-binding protein
MTYLLDTCIIADLLSPDPDPKLLAWVDSQPEEMMFISVVTLAELKQAIESCESSKTRVRMNDWLMNDLVVRFSGRISEITTEATLKWGELSARIHTQGGIINPIDSLTLAIALIYNHTIVTSNTSIFVESEIRLLNPYEQSVR